MMSKNCLKRVYIIAIGIVLHFVGQAQETALYPGNWWVGMKNPKVQIMIHGADVASGAAKLRINYPGVTLEKIHKVENPNYLFIDLNIDPVAKPGIVKITVIEQG